MRRARTEAEVAAALRLRFRVFCGEQGVDPQAEQDGRDSEALHLVVLEDGELIGTCRLLVEAGGARLGRMAIEPARRGEGAGAALLREADRAVAAAGAGRISLHAQLGVRGVYERAGYEPRGDVFLEEGIEHLTMEKRLA